MGEGRLLDRWKDGKMEMYREGKADRSIWILWISSHASRTIDSQEAESWIRGESEAQIKINSIEKI